MAADALSNLSSPGVLGGTLIIVGEDYGEGASVIQERSHAFALKSTLCLLDPRPDLPTMVRLVEHGFALSEASNMPVMLELRIRACHVRGSFEAADNRAGALSTRSRLQEPAPFDYGRLAHPPVTFGHEKRKFEARIPAAQAYIAEHGLNELLPGRHTGVGIIVQGGIYNALARALRQLGLADVWGQADIPVLVLNVTYPLVPSQIADFCRDKRAVLVVEEGQPEYIEQDIATQLRRLGVGTQLHGKDLLQSAGEYSVEVLCRGLLAFAQRHLPAADTGAAATWLQGLQVRRTDASRLLGTALPPRPPGFCIGCPERPVFSALTLVQQDLGPLHVAADIGCHAFGTFEPFSMGHSILGYGMSLASRAGVSPMMHRRSVALMGDGGFWHNGLLTGVQSALFNGDDAVLVIFKNGYTSATCTQDIHSTPASGADLSPRERQQSLAHTNQAIEKTLAGMGVGWLRTVTTYDVTAVQRVLSEALTTPYAGLKVVVAEGECQLERQRRVKPVLAQQEARGERTLRVKYGVDADVCNGDHACIRLSGCPTLTLKDNPDPLKVDPVATVLDGCVGCGLCGENAHAASLCPSFYRAEVVRHAGAFERWRDRLRRWMVRALEPA